MKKNLHVKKKLHSEQNQIDPRFLFISNFNLFFTETFSEIIIAWEFGFCEVSLEVVVSLWNRESNESSYQSLTQSAFFMLSTN